jgi:Rrf2 family protein
MVYSRSAEYAIRAFVQLAGVEDGKYAMVKNIAEEADIPAHFLAKILQQLARKGFLRSSKGPTGGFALRIPAEEITMLQIVDAVDGLGDFHRCPAGMAECNDQQPCGMHDNWKKVRDTIVEYLEKTTIADLARSMEQKKKAIDKKAAKAKKTAVKN